MVETVPHAASGVTSMWLDNGVRVHHRYMDQRKNEASISITLAGGPDPGDRGEPRYHRGGAARLGTSGDEPASSTEIRDLMTGAKVRVRGRRRGTP